MMELRQRQPSFILILKMNKEWSEELEPREKDGHILMFPRTETNKIKLK